MALLKIAGSVTKLKEGCFGPHSDEYLQIRKRHLVLVATIQLSLSAHSSAIDRMLDQALRFMRQSTPLALTSSVT